MGGELNGILKFDAGAKSQVRWVPVLAGVRSQVLRFPVVADARVRCGVSLILQHEYRSEVNRDSSKLGSSRAGVCGEVGRSEQRSTGMSRGPCGPL